MVTIVLNNYKSLLYQIFNSGNMVFRSCVSINFSNLLCIREEADSGLIISFVGFDAPNADPTTFYGGDAIIHFGWIHVTIGFCLPIISTLLVLLFDIDRDVHSSNLTDLGYQD